MLTQIDGVAEPQWYVINRQSNPMQPRLLIDKLTDSSDFA